MNKLSLFLVSLMLLMASNLMALNYNSSGNNTWAGSGFPLNVPLGDTVFIDGSDVITTSGNINIDGVVIINATATLSGTHKIVVKPSGYLYNDGTIDISKELHVDGEFYNAGSAYVDRFHSDGYVCNSGLIKLAPGKEFKHHGGEFECCGTVLADVVKFDKNTGVSLNGNSVAETSCQTFCNVNEDGPPTFLDPVTMAEFLNNLEPTESNINTDSVFVCFYDLPVELVKFDGYNDGGKNRITWRTASEHNNDYFVLEISQDGISFTEAGRIEGSGNSIDLISYTIIDNYYIRGAVNYYRLKQVDFDGVFEYHNIIAIDNTSEESHLIGIYNLNGQKVKADAPGMKVFVYDDGTRVRKY